MTITIARTLISILLEYSTPMRPSKILPTLKHITKISA